MCIDLMLWGIVLVWMCGGSVDRGLVELGWLNLAILCHAKLRELSRVCEVSNFVPRTTAGALQGGVEESINKIKKVNYGGL